MNKSKFIIVTLFIGLIGMLVANSLGLFNRMYGTEIFINNVAADRTFEAKLTNLLLGSIPDNDRSGCQISVRAVGYMDDSTKVSIPYFDQTSIICSLPKGKIDTVWGGDFYTSTAKINFLHQHAKKGNLRLSIAFSSPQSWGR